MESDHGPPVVQKERLTPPKRREERRHQFTVLV